MMAPLLVALMVAALSTESSCLITSTWYHQDQELLKALRDLSHASISPSPRSSGNVPAAEVHSAGGKSPGPGWWRSQVVLLQTARKRPEASSYNLNSFGLRYGK
uniref:Kisspeptin n=1 Tax=Cyclopterus lumpus TaxID=8103 RepID=A0A8C2XU66_CYCLU